MSYTVTCENLKMIYSSEKNKSKNLSLVNGIFFSVGTISCVLVYHTPIDWYVLTKQTKKLTIHILLNEYN